MESAPQPVGAFEFNLVYDDTLNQCVEKDCLTQDPARRCLDDNPDANAGATLGSGLTTWPDLGVGWDCDPADAGAEPRCDIDLETGPGYGVAHLGCLSTIGPYTSPVDADHWPLAVTTFNVLESGTDTLALRDVALADQDGAESNCNSVWGDEIPCYGASNSKTYVTPTPTYTPTPTPTATTTPDTGSGQVTVSEGGEVTSDDEENGVSPSDPVDTTVSVPAASANNDTTITITETSASGPGVPPAPSDLRVLGQVAVIETAPEATFNSENPATLTITYDDSVAPADESTIEVRRFAGSEWVPLDEPCGGGVSGTPLDPDPCISARDTDANSITIKTTSLSDWALMGPLAPVGGVAEYPDIAESRLSAGGSSSLPYSALVGVAAAVGAIAAGAWYARRRWRAG